MATKSVNAAETEPVPKAVVTYDEKADLLYISAGGVAPYGDTIANGVVMFYDRDPDEAGASADRNARSGRGGCAQTLCGRNSAKIRRNGCTR